MRRQITPRFLYPTARQFPFDEVCGNLVKALEQKQFNVPGIKVELYSYGQRETYSRVGTIEGDDFRLTFGRRQGLVDFELNNTAAVAELDIPLKKLKVCEDNSGPTFYLYVGTDWETDKQQFVHGFKVNSKYNGKPRTYLTYSGSLRKDRPGIYQREKIMPFLAHNDDLGREYSPQNGEPTYFETPVIFNEFKEFLEEKLEQIISN